MAELDALDAAILAELQSYARRTNRDIAAAVGVSPTTALDRTKSLVARGVIRGARLELDLAKLGRPVQALINVRVRPPSRTNIEAFRDWAVTLPEVLGLAVPDNDSLYTFVIDRLTQRKEIANVRTTVVYEHLQNPAPVPRPRRNG
jgi:DNA-binding Lrp family transcriptional regulator